MSLRGVRCGFGSALSSRVKAFLEFSMHAAAFQNVANMLRFGCHSQVRTFQLDTDGEADGETETRWNR